MNQKNIDLSELSIEEMQGLVDEMTPQMQGLDELEKMEEWERQMNFNNTKGLEDFWNHRKQIRKSYQFLRDTKFMVEYGQICLN